MSTLRVNPFGSAVDDPALRSHQWGATQLEDRREFPRWQSLCDLWLLDLEGLTVLRCQSDDVGPGGVSATIPIGYGLAVGQRYELRVRPGETDHTVPRPHWSACYGTIIRTKLRTQEQRDRLSVAIRFDAPQPFAIA